MKRNERVSVIHITCRHDLSSLSCLPGICWEFSTRIHGRHATVDWWHRDELLQRPFRQFLVGCDWGEDVRWWILLPTGWLVLVLECEREWMEFLLLSPSLRRITFWIWINFYLTLKGITSQERTHVEWTRRRHVMSVHWDEGWSRRLMMIGVNDFRWIPRNKNGFWWYWRLLWLLDKRVV